MTHSLSLVAGRSAIALALLRHAELAPQNLGGRGVQDAQRGPPTPTQPLLMRGRAVGIDKRQIGSTVPIGSTACVLKF